MKNSIVFCREIHWDDVIKTNTQTLAREFASNSWNCGWIAKAMTPWRYFYSTFSHTRFIWRKGGLDHKTIFEYSPLFLFSYGTSPILRSKFIWQSASKFAIPKLKNILINKDLYSPDICWIGSLSMGGITSSINAKKIIYQAHDAFSMYPDAPKGLKIIEEEMIRRSNLVLSTSVSTTLLLKNNYKQYSDRICTLSHGVDLDKYCVELSEPSQLNDIPRPRAVLVGTLDLEDENLIAYAATKLPEVSFVLIGPGGSKIRKIVNEAIIKNVYFVGGVSHEELPKYLVHCDVGLIAYPFQFKNTRRYGTNPMKRYEYAAAKLPTVSVQLNEYDLNPSPMFVAYDSDDFVKKILIAISTGESHRNELFDFAKQNTWQKKYNEVLKMLDKV